MGKNPHFRGSALIQILATRFAYFQRIITLCTKLSSAVYCNRSCLWVCGCLCGSVTTIIRNCVHLFHHTGPVGEGSDHLQLIKFWPSCAPGKGVCGGANNLLQPARSVCVSLSAFVILVWFDSFQNASSSLALLPSLV